jgi:surface protein
MLQWTTTGANQTITLPTDATLTYNIQIDWGAPQDEKNLQTHNGNSQTISHTYSQPGTHTITFWGSFPRLACANAAVCKQLVAVDQWGDTKRSSFLDAFYGASGLVINASDTPDLTNVRDMTNMFRGVTNLTGNFSGWNTSKVQNMTNAFYAASGFDQDISSRSVVGINAVGNLTNMFYGTQLSPYNYNALLDSRSKQPMIVVPTDRSMSMGTAKYGGCGVSNAQLGIEGHQRLGIKGRIPTDGGILPDCMRPFITTWLTEGTNPTITIPLGNSYSYDLIVDWGDGTTSAFPLATYPTIDHTYSGTFASGTTHQIKIQGRFPRLYCNGNAVCQKLISVDQWGDLSPRDMTNAFYGALNLTINATDTPNLINVLSMQSMFNRVANLTGNFSGWDTSTITNMYATFYAATNFSQDLSSWDVSRTTTMQQMFDGATNFNGSLSGRRRRGTDINLNYMFRNATNFNQPLNSWNTSGVTNMYAMFQNATSFNQPLSGWNVTKVIDMRNMFNGASSFNQDLSSWKISTIAGGYLGSFLDNSNLSTFHYNKLLDARVNFTGTKNSVTLGAAQIPYGGCETNRAEGIAAHDRLLKATNQGGKAWVITDGGLAP